MELVKRVLLQKPCQLYRLAVSRLSRAHMCRVRPPRAFLNESLSICIAKRK
jgi:hypothetical protein